MPSVFSLNRLPGVAQMLDTDRIRRMLTDADEKIARLQNAIEATHSPTDLRSLRKGLAWAKKSRDNFLSLLNAPA